MEVTPIKWAENILPEASTSIRCELLTSFSDPKLIYLFLWKRKKLNDAIVWRVNEKLLSSKF